MRNKHLEEIQKKAESDAEKRTKKKGKMKVSGAGVKRLQKIISKK